jgi:hypothetical protein
MKTKFTLNEINEMLPATQSWNGKNLVSSSPVEVRSMYADSYYIIKAGNKTISLPESKGFWLEGGIELFPSKIKPGISTVYVKEGNNIVLKQVDSVELVNEFIEYDYLCNTTNHNYILDDFLLHNFDLQDYINAGWLGCSNVDKTGPECCADWEDVLDTFANTNAAWVLALSRFFAEMVGNSQRWDDVNSNEYSSFYDSYNVDLFNAYGDYITAAARFFNSFRCSANQQTGTAIPDWPEGLPGEPSAAFITQTPSSAGPDNFPYEMVDLTDTVIPISVDFTGSTTFTENLHTQYKDTQLALGAAFAKWMKIGSGLELYGWDGSGKVGLVGHTSLNGNNRLYDHNDFANKTRYVGKIPGTNSTINHNLGTSTIMVQLFKLSDNKLVSDSQYTIDTLGSENSCAIEYVTPTPGELYRITILGFKSESAELSSGAGNSSLAGCTPPSNPGE